MPSKKLGRTWKADPHTLAKIAILQEYLVAYFPILGRSKRGRPFLYVDGFSGPGEYTNSALGSPLAALATAKSALAKAGDDWTAGDIVCVFIEPDPDRCAHLKTRVAEFGVASKMRVVVKEASFDRGMEEVRQEIPRSFASNDPLFVFIDPFGATGVPFKHVAEILKSDCSEVLINLDADGIARIFQAEANNNRDEQLTAIFGDDSWKSVLRLHEAFSVLCRRVLELYKAKLRAISKVEYVFAFEMRGAKDTLNYHLVFASRHPLGLEKMKEAMRTIDKSGRYSFSDGGIGQEMLFRFDKPEDYAEGFYQAFSEREAGYHELNKFALNETPFINPKGMLTVLENDDVLLVKSKNPKRRRGDFNEKTLISVTFLPRRPKQVQGDLFGG